MNGCNNRPRPTEETSYTAQNGWREYQDRGEVVRVPVWKKTLHAMSTTCQYDKPHSDPGCVGCIHRKAQP